MKQEHKPQDQISQKVKGTQRLILLSLGSIVALMTVMGVLSFALPKPVFSEYEKRELTPMPEFSLQALFSGSYLKDFEAHYADTFPFREGFIQLGALLEDLRGLRGEDDVKIYSANSQNAAPEPSSSQEASQPASQPSSVAPDASSSPEESQESDSQPQGGGGQSSQAESQGAEKPDPPPEVPDGYLTEGCFVNGDRACYLFGGYRPAAEVYAQYISAFADRVADQATVYNIVVPTSGEFYLPEKYQKMSASQKDNIDYLYGLYKEMGSKVVSVDAYSWLAMNTDQYIYFRTDHHWTALGAYYAYVAFCREMGISYPSIHEFEKKTIPDFRGTIYAETRDQKLGENPDYVDYYITATNYKAYLTTKAEPDVRYEVPAWADFAQGGNAYSVFIYGDNPLFEMDNLDIEDGSNVLVLKESYGNAFAPFLMASFDKVYVIDYRHYEASLYDFVMEHNIQTVIFINNSFAANTVYHADRINYLANQL